MKDIVHHVDAIFGGKPVRFELYRDLATVAALEAAVGSANAAWGRFLVGSWTVGDIRTVLALAHPKPADHEGRGLYRNLRSDLPTVDSISEQIGHLTCRSTGGSAAPLRMARGVPPERIDTTLATRPLATYAPLAGAIMQAAMIGIPAALATFDERTALDAARDRFTETSDAAGAAA